MPYFSALDGLRGVAVAGVLLFHAGYDFAKGGFLGVSSFFTLSGFLITSLLVTEWRGGGGVGLRHFWGRRIRRLMPAALLGLGLITAFGAFAADARQVDALRGDVLSALFDVANWRFIFSGQGYAALFSQPSPVQHFWSLAIEEQFYLVFPLVLVGVMTWRHGSRRALGVVAAAGALASTVLMIALYRTGHTARLYYGTDTRVAELLVGVLLATILVSRGPVVTRAGRAAVSAAGLAAAVGIGAMWYGVTDTTPWLFHGGFLLHAVLTGLVIVAAIQTTPVRWVLSLAPLRQLGRISYGVYVYHWPIFLWLSADRTGLDRTPLFLVRLAVTLAVSIASFVLVERPIRRARHVPRLAWFMAPAGIAFVALCVVVVTLNPPRPPIVFAAAFGRSRPPADVYLPSHRATRAGASSAAPVRAPRMMIVGDSVAQTLGRGIERWGASTHEASVWNVARYYCGIGRGGAFNLIGARPASAGCDAWPTQWGHDVDAFHPDVVVVLSTLWDLFDREFPGWNGFRKPGDPLWNQWLLENYEYAVDVLSAHGAHVMWLAIPCIRDAGVNVRGQTVDATVLPQLAKARPDKVTIVDFGAKICPNGQFSDRIGDVQEGRPDGLHFSDTGADAVAKWLGPELAAAAPNAGTPVQ
jgi:peptidoglycan/LPS O-acetylase OafA/YrhL